MRLRNHLLIIAGLAAICLAPCYTHGQAVVLPAELPAWIRLNLNPAEAELLADAADGQLNHHDLLSAALVVNGIREPVAHERYRQQYESWIAELLPTLSAQPDAAARAERIFSFLQSRVLRGKYHESCSSLAGLFEHGQYNCVSSTVVFCCLAERLQISVQAAESPGHVIARLSDAAESLDIETTCRDWSHGSKPSASKSQDGYRGISRLGLLALAYYNRGVDALESGDFDRAVIENVKALRLDPASRTARANLLAALNNGALSLSDRGSHDAALDRLRFARSIAAEFEPAATNLQIVRRRKVLELCDRQEFIPALKLLADSCQENPNDAELQAFELAVTNREGLRLLDAGRTEDAVGWYRQALNRHPAEELFHANLRVAVMRWADEAFRQHDYAEAISRTEYAGRPGELDTARLNNLRYGYQQWVRRLRATGRDAEALRVTRQAANDPFLAWPVEAKAQPASADLSDLTPAQG